MICVTKNSIIMDLIKKEIPVISEYCSCQLFRNGEDAYAWAKNHFVQIAVLDLHLLDVHAVGLALRLKESNPEMQIIFTRFSAAMDVEYWVLETGRYTLKKISVAELAFQLQDFLHMKSGGKNIVIETIPRFSVSIDGAPFYLAREKVRELFALLVDCGGSGITTKEAISYLWPDRPNDTKTQALFRVTYKRLVDTLKTAGIDYIISSKGFHRFLLVNQIDCDLYRIFSGDEQTARKYNGKYLQEYSWAEERNGQLYRMLIANK